MAFGQLVEGRWKGEKRGHFVPVTGWLKRELCLFVKTDSHSFASRRLGQGGHLTGRHARLYGTRELAFATDHGYN